MLVAVTNCVSHGGALFFRKPREARPIECSLLDLHEIAGETGISVDDVISQLDDFASADTLLGVGAPFFSPPYEKPPLAPSEEISVFSVRTTFDPVDTILEPAAAIFEDETPPETETAPPARPETVEPEIIIEENTSIFMDATPSAPEMPPLRREPEPATEDDPPIVETVAAPEEAPILSDPASVAETIEIIETAAEAAKPETEPMASAPAVVARPARRKPFAPEGPLAKMTRAKLEKIRKVSTVRVEAAEPEDDGEDEPLIDLTVPQDYAVQTTTENIVWPWEVREDLTLKEALESLDDKLLTSLTEEVVSCTISGEMGEGGIKSLCETYGRAKEQIYSAIQHESRRRITRMNTKPRTGSAIGSDATQEMAMRMAKQFLQNEMGKDKATRFESTIPSEDGNYYIFQKHRVEDEDSVEFPNERVYYRETGNGWAISVGY